MVSFFKIVHMNIKLSVFFCFFYCWSWGQLVVIPDTQFKKALLAHYPVVDLNFDGEISTKEAVSYSGMLNISLKQIHDLTGIEAFVNLTGLKCNHNQIESLNLSQNKALTFLGCLDNKLT